MNSSHAGLFGFVALAAACSSPPSEKVPNSGADGGSSGSDVGGAGGVATGGSGGFGAIGTGGSGIELDSGAGTGAGGSGVEPDAACAEGEVQGERTPGNILFVVDRSGSMNCNPPPLQGSQACEQSPRPVDASQPSKWQIVKDALTNAINSLPPSSSAGIVYFPTDDFCAVTSNLDVPVDMLDAAHVGSLTQSLGSVSPAGNTPIVGGVTLGYRYLDTTPMIGNRFVVLLTDGAETCARDQVMHFGTQTVPTAQAVGIRTFVIGAPGSESARAFLSAIAYNGGTAISPTCDHSGSSPTVGDCHYDMTTSGAQFAQQLNQALDAIAGSTVSCDIAIPAPPEGVTLDLNKVNVTIDLGTSQLPLYQDNTAACNGGADGWQYNFDRTRIALCGSACDTYKARRNATVKVELGCEVRFKIT